MEDTYLFDSSIHANRFKKFDIFAEENKHVLDNLVVTVDGTICGVKINVVANHLKDPEIKKMRVGALNIPNKWKVENEDELYRLLSVYVSLDDYF